MHDAPAACRSCGGELNLVMADLGRLPLANGLVAPARLATPAPRHPLRAMVCEGCWLVQLDRDLPAETMFADYLYFSSYSESWLAHAKRHAETMIRRLSLGPQSRVVEIASNDGYLLRNFVEAGIPCLGIEPAANVAAVAMQAGVPTMVAWFGAELAATLAATSGQADLIVANNVLAHVPDPHDFIAGVARLLAQGGVWTVEFPHLARLLAESQFDTIYHEHVCYFSLLALEPLLARHGLEVSDVEELPTHGGSLRLHVRHAGRGPASPAVDALRAAEREAGLGAPDIYRAFPARIARILGDLVAFVQGVKARGERIAAYGAAAKGATLLDSAGLSVRDIAFVADRSPHKQGLCYPGSGLPILPPEEIARTRPDWVLILPWNLAEEISAELGFIGAWGGRFLRAVPELKVWAPA
ncbi:MAG: class I SAM-dependent methyltransferase [Alphaproteobacteria bacterium]|nr:class I SAM-dependent methyltransferase [Alphaproteobacteria bacterium]